LNTLQKLLIVAAPVARVWDSRIKPTVTHASQLPLPTLVTSRRCSKCPDCCCMCLPINCGESLTAGETVDLGVEDDQSVEYGVRHCQEMSIILQRLINDGIQCRIYKLPF